MNTEHLTRALHEQLASSSGLKTKKQLVTLVHDQDGELRALPVAPVFKQVQADLDQAVERALDRLLQLVSALLSPKLLEAALARNEWVDRLLHNWHVLMFDEPVSAAHFIKPTNVATMSFGGWPINARPADVIQWLKRSSDQDTAERLIEIIQGGKLDHPWLIDGQLYCAPMAAVLYLAEQDVETGRRKPSVAIDSDMPHHKLIASWNRLPKHHTDRRRLPVHKYADGCILELLEPGQGVQLRLDLPGATPSEIVTRRLRQIVGSEGLRHWAAFTRLLSIEGNRQGWVRWTIEDHHKAMQFAPQKSRDPAVRANTIELMELFGRLELAVIGPDGKERERRPLILVGSRHERLNEQDHWEIDGMEVRINPLLYSGVRKDNGQLGTNFWPQSDSLPKIDHKRYPYTHGLGLILPIRWRLAWNDGRDFVSMSGENLLRTAGIRYDAHNPQRAWRSLNRDLQQLRRRDCLGRVELDGEPDELTTIYRLYPPQWQLDRTHRQLPAVDDAWQEVLPLTGAELKEWRQNKGWSQAKLARKADVSRSTIVRAEGNDEKRLSRRLRSKLEQI